MGQTTESIVRIMSAEEIVARGGGDPSPLLWPQRTVWFAERAMRLKQLARNHAAGDFLSLMAALVQAQHELLNDYPRVRLPSEDALDAARRHGAAALDVLTWQRDPAWRQGLSRLIDQLDTSHGDTLRDVFTRLRSLDESTIEAQADLILAGSGSGLDLVAAPFIGAALQAYWTHMVCAVAGVQDMAQYAAMDLNDASLCPCCGSAPVASVTRATAKVAGQRYVACSLCGTQWNMVRIKCARCRNEDKITYLSLDPAEAGAEASRASHAAVMAEACDSCGSYLKVMHTDRDPSVDAVADDLASLALDVLVADTGKVRYGVNLFLLFSEPAPDPSGDSTAGAH